MGVRQHLTSGHAASAACYAAAARGLHWGTRGEGAFKGLKDAFYCSWTAGLSWESLSTVVRWLPCSVLLGQAAGDGPQGVVLQRWGGREHVSIAPSGPNHWHSCCAGAPQLLAPTGAWGTVEELCEQELCPCGEGKLRHSVAD